MNRKSELATIKKAEQALEKSRQQTMSGVFRTRKALFRRMSEPSTLLWVGAISFAGGYLLTRLPQSPFARQRSQQAEGSAKSSPKKIGVLGQFILGLVGQNLMRFITMLRQPPQENPATTPATSVDEQGPSPY